MFVPLMLPLAVQQFRVGQEMHLLMDDLRRRPLVAVENQGAKRSFPLQKQHRYGLNLWSLPGQVPNLL